MNKLEKAKNKFTNDHQHSFSYLSKECFRMDLNDLIELFCKKQRQNCAKTFKIDICQNYSTNKHDNNTDYYRILNSPSSNQKDKPQSC